MKPAIPTVQAAPRTANQHWFRALILAFAITIPVLQAVLFLGRANQNFQIGMDFRLTYTAAVAWTQGENPYDDEALKRIWSRCGMPHATPPGLPQTPNVYPLTIAPLLSPLAAMQFPQALAVWLVINATCIAVLLIQILNTPTAHPKLAVAAACIFMLGFPLHYGFLFGNLAVLTVFLLVQSLRFKNQPALAGLCLGLAMVKYSLCAPLAMYWLLTRRWRIVAIAGLVQMALIAIATYGGGFNHPADWLQPMLETARASLEPGQANHHAALAYTSLHLELPALLYRIAPSLDPLRHLAVGLLIAALVTGLVRAHRRPSSQTSAAVDSHIAHIAILAVTLLAFYHRTYDMTVVLFPLLIWLIVSHDQLPRRLRACLWVAAAATVVPGATFQGGSSEVPWVILVGVQSIATWSLLAIAGCSIAHLHRAVPCEHGRLHGAVFYEHGASH